MVFSFVKIMVAVLFHLQDSCPQFCQNDVVLCRRTNPQFCDTPRMILSFVTHQERSSVLRHTKNDPQFCDTPRTILSFVTPRTILSFATHQERSSVLRHTKNDPQFCDAPRTIFSLTYNLQVNCPSHSKC